MSHSLHTSGPTALDVYVPQVGELAWILPAAGIVGTPLAEQPDTVCIEFEGNRYGSENLRTFAQRVHVAADRHRSGYPTIARAVVDAEELLPVGTYDPTTRSTTVSDHAALLAWLQTADPAVSEPGLEAELASPIVLPPAGAPKPTPTRTQRGERGA